MLDMYDRKLRGLYIECFERSFFLILILIFTLYSYYIGLFASSTLIYLLLEHLIFFSFMYRVAALKIKYINRIWLWVLKRKGFKKLEGSKFPIYSKDYTNLKDYLYFLELNVEGLHNISSFVASGHSIILTSRKDYPSMSLKSKEKMVAFYQPLLKVIVLFIDDLYLKSECKPCCLISIRERLYHEYGHYLDYFYAVVSKSRTFIRYFKTKKASLIKDNQKLNAYMYWHRTNFYKFIYKSRKSFKQLGVICKLRYAMFNSKKDLAYKFTNSGEFFAENYMEYCMGRCDDVFCKNLFKKND